MNSSRFGIFTLVVVLFMVGVAYLTAWLNDSAMTWLFLFVPALAGLAGSSLLWVGGRRFFSGSSSDNPAPNPTSGSQSTEIQHVEAAQSAPETPPNVIDTHSIFLNNISHELRTPLSIILGYAEIIEQDAQQGGNDGISTLAQKIKLYTKHLSAIVNDLLYMTEIQSGELKFLLEAFTLDNVVEQAIKQVQPYLDANENELLLIMPPDAGMMMADRDKVRIILVNLLSNAAKFTQNGTVTLSAYRQVVGGEERVVFQVSDTGIGIAPELQETIFQPFQQVDGSFTRQHSGLGLGLAINRHYCEMMGGKMTVQSEPGRGSIFTVSLPAEVTAVAAMYVRSSQPANLPTDA